MRTEELIERAQDRMATLMAEGDSLIERLNVIGDEIATVADELKSLRELMARFDPGAEEESVPLGPTETADSWAMLSLAQAVMNALGLSDKPLGPNQIKAVLKEHGKDSAASNISATLNYLAKQGNARALRRGEWVLITDPVESRGRKLMDQIASDARARIGTYSVPLVNKVTDDPSVEVGRFHPQESGDAAG